LLDSVGTTDGTDKGGLDLDGALNGTDNGLIDSGMGYGDECSDGNEDGSSLDGKFGLNELGVKLSLDEELEDGFKDGSLKCKWASSSVSLYITTGLSSKFFYWPIL
jgi:hypothetical protein